MTDLEDQAIDLFTEVLGLSPEQRGARLEAEGAAVPELRARVEELLAHHHEAEAMAFLEPPLLPDSSEVLPRRFGNYELLEVMGVGGQGVVYRARQIHIDKEVALKLVNPRDRRRSLRELKIAADLEHEHLVRVYHVGEQEGQLYFTMKLAEKGSLDKHIGEYHLQTAAAVTAADRQAVEERKKRIAGFLAKIARAVHYIHKQGFIHCDLKPRNLLLDAQGKPLVTDFGVARRIGDAAGPDGGTVGYMSPEHVQRRTDLTGATDIYALGVILYELLTTRRPFEGTPDEKLATADPELVAPFPSAGNPNVGTHSDLELICRKCLVKELSGRYATAAALADDLECYACDEETSVRPRSWVERALRGVVKAVNHKLAIDGIARWGAIDLWDAGTNLLANGALFVLIRTDQPPALLWLTLFTFVVVWWWMFLTYLFRYDRIEPSERNLALLWAGVTLANVTLFSIYCPPFGSSSAAELLAYYPPWAVVNGVAFLVVGRLYWGYYYLVGLAHFLVAALMPLRLDHAPLVYGVFVAVCMAYGASDHFRTARHPKAP
jgi:serine/threonine-protein kinase